MLVKSENPVFPTLVGFSVWFKPGGLNLVRFYPSNPDLNGISMFKAIWSYLMLNLTLMPTLPEHLLDLGKLKLILAEKMFLPL